ncbi:FecR family protein [Hymenobacter terricola]|uniref:FecR family protein n=1 Tax=Hymenobacter terricola TaxID=2819236 RepID=UPI001B314460|nr:FecR domain-containing protein [Hymenobacter terricola]
MDFTQYSVDDFVVDESFQAFVALADSEAGRFWQAWLSEHPEKKAEADQAFVLVQGLRQARPYPLADYLLPQELQRLRLALNIPAARPQLRVQRRLRVLTGTLAVLLLLVGLGWWQLHRPAAPAGKAARFATRHGQQRRLTLPDGSVVVLNGNSTLTTAAQWTPASPREVWLTGEGYFQVTHLAPPAVMDIAGAPANVKFVVHAGGLNVAVLGTEFNVNSRPGSTKVVLSSGKVAVERQALLTRENLLMQPGDLVETSAVQPGLTRRHVRPALYSDWTQGRLKFDQTPMRDVVQLLRDSYGLQVEVTDPAIMRQTVVGQVPTTTPDVLLDALAKSLEIKIVRNGSHVRFLPASR